MGEQQATAAELAALHHATQKLMAAQTQQEICEIAVTAAENILELPLCGVWIASPDQEALQLIAHSDQAATIFNTTITATAGNARAWSAFESQSIKKYRLEPCSHADSSRYNPQSGTIFPLGGYGILHLATTDESFNAQAVVQIGQLLSSNTTAALERATREHTLRLQHDQLEEFIGFVSHDLRNPLNVASGHVDLAKQACTDAEETFDTIESALDRMNTLIEDLLALATHGNVIHDRTAVDLETLALTAWENVHTGEATLTIEGSTTLSADRNRLQQVFENLFRNAIENSQQAVSIRVGPIEPITTTTRSTVAGGPTGFYIADDGPGIQPETRDAILASGYSTNESTGIGLTIVQRIIDAHGWKFDVSTSAEGGAQFDITDGTRLVTTAIVE